MKIYTITLVKFDNEDYTRKYCWGFFADKITAEQVVLANNADMFDEGYYNYAVVEEVSEGWGLSIAISWFSATYNVEDDTTVVVSCSYPGATQYCNWSMG